MARTRSRVRLEEEKSTQTMERVWTPRSLICETPVRIHQDPPLIPNAPKKSMVFLCRTQQPPPGSLQEEWLLEPYGMRGRWGYVFKYETGNLCLYQLDEEDEKLGPLTTVGMLTSNDWGVLKLGGASGSAEEVLTVKEEPEEIPATSAAKRLRLESPLDDFEPKQGWFSLLCGNQKQASLAAGSSVQATGNLMRTKMGIFLFLSVLTLIVVCLGHC